jgi:ligand-binding SRPBCC domain-containing protein
MQFDHRFRVAAPLSDVRAFHARSAGMGELTPPPAIVRVHEAPELLGEGDTMRFTIWLGPVPVRWLARIEQVDDHGFVDRQLEGPFDSWVHTHRFEPDAADEAATWVIDRVEAQPSRHPLWGPVAWSMWLTLPLLFRFRAWQTRRLLARQGAW